MVEEENVWRIVFYVSYGKEVSFGEMIGEMLDSLEVTESGVMNELKRIIEKTPKLIENTGNQWECG